MTQVRLEHVNVTVSDLKATTTWMRDIFGWELRWEGASIYEGRSAHVGGADSYVALYQPPTLPSDPDSSYTTRSGLNHIAVVVGNVDSIEAKVVAAGFTPTNHADYEPGRRFYFYDHDGIEFEVVQY